MTVFFCEETTNNEFSYRICQVFTLYFYLASKNFNKITVMPLLYNTTYMWQAIT